MSSVNLDDIYLNLELCDEMICSRTNNDAIVCRVSVLLWMKKHVCDGMPDLERLSA